MNTRLHVGNLAAPTTARDLQDLFSAYGNVAEVNLPVERESGRPRGFAIVTMATPQGAQAARLELNGREVGAHVLTVIEHVPMKKEEQQIRQSPVARTTDKLQKVFGALKK